MDYVSMTPATRRLKEQLKVQDERPVVSRPRKRRSPRTRLDIAEAYRHKEREIADLYLQGMTYKQIGECMDMARSLVEMCVYRMRKRGIDLPKRKKS